MAKRTRRPTPPGDYKDPLNNYDPPEYADELERSLAEDQIQDMNAWLAAQVSPDATVAETLKLMVDCDIACVLIVDRGKLEGIFSERDVLNRLTDDFESLRDQPISEVMTPNPVYLRDTDSPAKAINLMATGGFRHVPVLDVDDKVVGILGPRRVTAFLDEHFQE